MQKMFSSTAPRNNICLANEFLLIDELFVFDQRENQYEKYDKILHIAHHTLTWNAILTFSSHNKWNV